MADVTITTDSNGTQEEFNGHWGPYWISPGSAVLPFLDAGADLSIGYTIDNGSTWSSRQTETNAAKQLACFYDREVPNNYGSGIHTILIDSVFTGQTPGSGVFYANLDATTGSFGTFFNIAEGVAPNSTSRNNKVAITKNLSGGLVAAFYGATVTSGLKSTDGGSTWTGISNPLEGGNDHIIMFPANTGDNNDVCAIYWDADANEISLKMYDDSADSWTESSIATSMTDSARLRNMDAAVRWSDKHIILAAHNAGETAGDDVKVWDINPNDISSPTITAKTDAWTNLPNSAQCGITINQQNGSVYLGVIGSTAFGSTEDIQTKVTGDGADTWSAKSQYNTTTDDYRYLSANRSITTLGGTIGWAFNNDDLQDIFTNAVNSIAIGSILAATDYTETLSDSMSLADSIASSAEYNLSLDDSIGMADTPGTAANYSRSESDSLSISDSLAKIASYLRTASDSISITDSLTSEKGRHLSLSDTFSMADSLTQEVNLAISDNVSLSDSLTKEVIMQIADSLGISDSIAQAFSKAISDTFILADALSKSEGLNLSENFNLSDSLVTSIFKYVVLSDSLSITDSLNSYKTSPLYEDFFFRIQDEIIKLRNSDKNRNLKADDKNIKLRY